MGMTDTPTIPTGPASPGFIVDTGHGPSGIGFDHAREMAQHAIASGVSREAVDASLRAEGYDPAGVFAEAPAQTNRDLAAFNEGGLRGVTLPELEGQPIAYSHDVIANFNTTELAAFDKAAKFAAVDMRLPPASAVSTIQTLVEAAARADAIPADQRQAWNDAQDRRLIQALGEDGAKQAVDLAAAALKRIGDANFLARLNASGVLRDPTVIVALAHAEDVTQTRHLMHEGRATVASIVEALSGA
jgi:hypothetical protein